MARQSVILERRDERKRPRPRHDLICCRGRRRALAGKSGRNQTPSETALRDVSFLIAQHVSPRDIENEKHLNDVFKANENSLYSHSHARRINFILDEARRNGAVPYTVNDFVYLSTICMCCVRISYLVQCFLLFFCFFVCFLYRCCGKRFAFFDVSPHFGSSAFDTHV